MGFKPKTFRPVVRRANHYATGAVREDVSEQLRRFELE